MVIMMAKRWVGWLVLAILLAFIYYLGETQFHKGDLWFWFPVILLLVIILVLLAFSKLRTED